MAVRLKSWPHELPTTKLNRRAFARKLGEMSLATLTICHTDALAAAEPNPSQTSTGLRDRVRGLLLGSMIGDAAGGPVEFKPVSEVRKWLPDARSWPESKRLNDEEIHELSSSLPLLPYKDIRPEPAPYGPWAEDGPPGTITDDSRHKMVLIRALRGLREAGDQQLTVKGLAQSYLDFGAAKCIVDNPAYRQLYEESFHEYNLAARWILGERRPELSRPASRLWGGVATVSGQMCLPPLAALFPGDPEQAYRAAYSIGFIDLGTGKDMNAAVVAGLAAALSDTNPDTKVRWRSTLTAMRTVDPYDYADIKFVSRPLLKWLDFAESAARRAAGRPARLYEILEKEGRPVYWWDAHFIITSALAFLHLCQFEPLAAMHLSLDFGHDTDSVAQTIGAFAGAIHGTEIFPQPFREAVTKRLSIDYGEDINEWVDLLVELSDRSKYPQPVSLE
jgi:ADP-ribosylglycohydrolase